MRLPPAPLGQVDIAKKVGVSQSTVSRALKNDPTISPEMRNRIMEAAQSLGYRPDLAVQTLVNRRWAKTGSRGLNIACLIGQQSKDYQRTEVARAAAKSGFALSEFRVSEYRDLDYLRRVLRARGIRGVVLDSVLGGEIEKLDLSEFSVVQVGIRWCPIQYHWIGHDFYALTRDLIEGAIQRGYRRIGCLFVKSLVRWDDDMRIAAVDGIRERHPDVLLPPISWLGVKVPYESNVQLVAEFIKRWKPQCLIGFNGFLLYVLRSLKISVPDQIAVGLLHGDPASGAAVSPVFAEAPVANMAIRMLHGMLRDNERGIPSEPMSLVVRTHRFDWSPLPVYSGKPSTRTVPRKLSA